MTCTGICSNFIFSSFFFSESTSLMITTLIGFFSGSATLISAVLAVISEAGFTDVKVNSGLCETVSGFGANGFFVVTVGFSIGFGVVLFGDRTPPINCSKTGFIVN